jgi:ligand-binding SRPBCC domain-containing protein
MINAPVQECFDLARSIDFHVYAAQTTREQAVGGMTTGLISEGEEVEWKAKHFGLWWKMRVRITAFRPPGYFQDSMVKGPFRSFTHDHTFDRQGPGTLMTDTVTFQSPILIAGGLFDVCVLNKYLLRFLQARNKKLKVEAESKSWPK